VRKAPPIHTQRLIYFQCIASRCISLGYALREFAREGYRSCLAIFRTDRRGKAMKRCSIRLQRLICFKYFTTLIKSKFNESKSLDALLDFKKSWVEQIAKKTSRIRYSFQLSIPLFILFNLIAFASHAQSFLDAKQSGKDLANSLLGQVQNNAQQDINNKHASTDTSVATSINYKGTDVPERNYTNENIDAAKNQKAADKNNTEASIVSSSFLRAKEYPISLSDSFLDKANDAGKNPENYVDWLSGKYTDCNQEGGEEVLSKSSHTCDEFKEIKDNTCSVGRSIEVDGKHKYTCPRKLNKFEKTCTKSLTVAIDKQENCNAGIVEYLGSPDKEHFSTAYIINGDYKYPSLNINILLNEEFNWSATISVTRKIEFNIKDKSQLSTFTLKKIDIEGVGSVSLNGNLLFSAPKGSHTITSRELRTESRNGGYTAYFINDIKARDFIMGLRKASSPSMDLMPYIKTGKNEIIFRGIPKKWYGHKLTNIAMEAKQVCFTEKESWLEQCSEVRS